MALYASEGSGGGSKFAPHAEGQFAVVCGDVIDLGMVEETWDGETKTKHKCQLRFFSTERDQEGGPKWLTTGRMTVSLNEKAALRKLLKAWRGKDFTETELQRFDLETLIGVPAYVQVGHQVAKTGDRTYARIDSIMRLPAGMTAPEIPEDYTRQNDRSDDRVPQAAAKPAPAPAKAAPAPEGDVRGYSASEQAMVDALEAGGAGAVTVEHPAGGPDADIPFVVACAGAPSWVGGLDCFALLPVPGGRHPVK